MIVQPDSRVLLLLTFDQSTEPGARADLAQLSRDPSRATGTCKPASSAGSGAG